MSRKGVLRFLLQILLPGTLSALLIASLGSVQPVAAATPYIDNSFTSTSSAPVGAYGLNKSFFPSTGDYTAEIWARRDGTYAANTRYTLFSSNGKYLYVYNNNFWWHHDDGSDTDTGVVAPKDEWFHVAVVVTTSTKTLKLVLNGATTAWSKTFTTLTTTAGFVGIGASNYVSPYNFWQGQLDQFKVWASVLSDAQLSQSMNTYQSAGITGSPTLNFLYDMNTVSVNNIDAIVGTNSLAVVGPGQFAWTDVKTTDSSTIPGKTIYGFPRTYLNAEGGWRAPTGMNATYQYLSVAGGGGGGSGRGGGGGAGGFLTGSVSIPSSAVYSVIVGAGGYANTNGGNTQLQNVNASSAVVASTGGGGGGNGSTAADGLAGGSGGGASICYAAGPVRPQGGAGVAGQGNAGASNDGTNCTTSPEFRQTGGGGGSSAAGVAGSGGSNNPTAATAGQVRPDGGAGTVSSITGTAVTYAAGGGGAIALATGQPGGVINSAYFGSGGSAIGGNGAAVGGYGSAATPNTGSGGGGGGYISASNYLYTGGMGSNGVLSVSYTHLTLPTTSRV